MRCDTCGRSWTAAARFCGRCGQRLGSGRADRSDQAEAGGSRGDARWSSIVPVGAWIATAVVVLVVMMGTGGVTWIVDPTAGSEPVRGDVSVPSADAVGGVAVRAADRGGRLVDCSEDLTDLPRHVRHYGLYIGQLEWHEGRLCARLSPETGGPQPRCDPPAVLACVVP